MSDHWSTSRRRSELPPNWETLRAIVGERAGGRCEHTADGQRCTMRGTDCDHINGRHDHSLGNLAWLCHPHHAQKTAREAAAAKASAEVRAKSTRPAERHPGLA